MWLHLLLVACAAGDCATRQCQEDAILAEFGWRGGGEPAAGPRPGGGEEGAGAPEEQGDDSAGEEEPELKSCAAPAAAVLAYFPAIQQALRRLDRIYAGHSCDKEYLGGRGAVPIEFYKRVGYAATYGEILPASVADVLRRVGAKPGQRYVDLGSGTGKTAVLAWLLGLRATGVELAAERWGTACDALERARGLRPAAGAGDRLRFVRGSLFDLDIADADIVLFDSVMYPPDAVQRVAELVRRTRPGTLVVSAGDGLPAAGLRPVERVEVQTTWKSQRFTVQANEARVPDGKKPRDHPEPNEVCEL